MKEGPSQKYASASCFAFHLRCWCPQFRSWRHPPASRQLTGHIQEQEQQQPSVARNGPVLSATL
eukprot:1116637-Rhodomonas_salina.2